MKNDELWQVALGEIELSISKANFITWFKNTSIISNENGKVVIGVPNGFAKEWLENKYNTYIYRALRNFQDDIKEISCVIYSPQQSSAAEKKGADPAAGPAQYERTGVNYVENATNNAPAKENVQQSLNYGQESNINPRYTFDNFIVGENNELARAACYAVSQNLGKIYNPLFIYGGVGLGKTHLLQSIGNEILKKDPHKKIKYITSERFANELIDSIRNQTINDFKASYQQIDLLIIDDIQFLAGKEKTQNEFFHIFNALYQINKQIVLSSDRPPKSIATLEERLRSRFEGGMIADVSKPDLETRTAILKAKLAEKSFYLEDDAIKFVAEHVKNNIRELEGSLNRIIAACEFNKKAPTLELVQQALSELISSGKKKGVQHAHIIEAVAQYFGIDKKDLINKGRKKEIARARQIAMYLMRKELSASYPGIGDLFGGRDHTTALHAYEKINKEIEFDEKLKEDVAILKEKIYVL
ncbi:MAG: Chromosomal replication initiator protein DnaA [Candidatus Moranbacteria bacterium GW2011_GWE1_49_15]|nr:MAG: Chromosomal replication initiator protein DnaA [Candidatus Moranbacteria bacterium GW2011_GWE2_47_10]KKW07349.1 MAG: Chromosomal replication initiator protein DnaA [Candidatus Moranbacteria bacterium GW2011_GWE1_49_15]HBP00823.1 chromosomal replication initiator protein DnaA [Candidatus Moranbacteria bacterium]